GEYRVSGKVALEMRLVDRHVLDANAMLVAPDIDHPIDHQKRITVRQHFQDDRDVGRLERCHDLVHDSISVIGGRPAAALLPREPRENLHLAEPLLDRFGRSTAPSRARWYVAMNSADCRDLRALAYRDVVIQSNARTQHNKVLESGAS